MPPPSPSSVAVLFTIDELVALNSPSSTARIPPPSKAVLWLTVVPVRFTNPNSTKMPPPTSATLFVIVELFTFTVESAVRIPPPSSLFPFSIVNVLIVTSGASITNTGPALPPSSTAPPTPVNRHIVEHLPVTKTVAMHEHGAAAVDRVSSVVWSDALSVQKTLVAADADPAVNTPTTTAVATADTNANQLTTSHNDSSSQLTTKAHKPHSSVGLTAPTG